MRIIRLDAYRFDVSAKTCWAFMALRTDDGRTGWGEITTFGREGELARLCAGLDASLREAPAHDLTDLENRIWQATPDRNRRAVMSALEQAFLGLVAEAAGESLQVLLGGTGRALVPYYANINRGITDRSPEGFAAQARAVVAETAATGVKIAPFDGLRWNRQTPDEAAAAIQLGLDRVAAVRAVLPEDARLLVDCHGRFDPFLARQMFRGLGAQNVYWVEEPCQMEILDAAEQRALRSAANNQGMRLAGGEEILDCAGMAALLAAGGHDVVLPDLRLTGIRQGMAMLAQAEATQVSPSLHNPVGPVLDHISAQVAAAVPGFLILERQVGESADWTRLRGSPVRLAGGAVIPETGAPAPVAELMDRLGSPTDTAPLSFQRMGGAGPDA